MQMFLSILPSSLVLLPFSFGKVAGGQVDAEAVSASGLQGLVLTCTGQQKGLANEQQ